MKNRIILLHLIVLLLGISGCKEETGRRFRYFSNYSRTFRDFNDKHLIAARAIGVDPEDVPENLDRCRGLKSIRRNRFYEIDKLTHSKPYLVPESKKLLKTIGKNFQDSLKAKGLAKHSIIVTSVFRCEENVRKLRKGNINASRNSAHCYGTTFDIAYARFKPHRKKKEEDPQKLKSVLAEVLRDLRDEGKCYVRYEVKQGCFHITARPSE